MAKKLVSLAKNLLAFGSDASSPSSSTMARQQTVPHVAYLLIDHSISMKDDLKEAVEGALTFFRSALKRGYYVGLISFASDAEFVLEPTRDLEAIRSRLASMTAGGTTNMTKAIELAAHYLSIGDFPRAAVLVTDGMPDDENGTLAAAQRVRRLGIDLIAIGTGSADQAFLSRLTNRTELAVRVERPQLKQAISSAAKLLPGS